VAAVMEEGARRWFEALPRVDDLPTDPAKHTAALFEAVDASLESHPEFLRLLLLIALERRDVDLTSLAVIRRVRELALERIRRMLVFLLTPLKLRNTQTLADEFARLVLVVADRAFVAQHIDPGQPHVRRSFSLLRSALTALAVETDRAARRKRR